MKKVPEGLEPADRAPYCGDPGALVGYLYNDGSAEELAAIATHVQSCDSCIAELAALGDTRELLSAWSPPQTELGLTLTSDALPIAVATPATPSHAVPVADTPWWRQATPVWMQALAATMVFAAGMAIGLAACMVGSDKERITSLPRLSGEPAEVIVFKSQRNGYDQAARTTGAYTLVGCTVGPGFDYADFTMMREDADTVRALRERRPELLPFL